MKGEGVACACSAISRAETERLLGPVLRPPAGADADGAAGADA